LDPSPVRGRRPAVGTWQCIGRTGCGRAGHGRCRTGCGAFLKRRCVALGAGVIRVRFGIVVVSRRVNAEPLV
jgi:hypothetical protein